MSRMQSGFWTTCLFCGAVLAGCNASSSPATPGAAGSAVSLPSVEGAKYLLPAEPAGAQPIVEAKEQAKNDDEVVVVGRIGGDVNPWIEGRAAFSLVDLSLKACSDIHGDGCPTPWDYCCETDKLGQARTLVKVVDADGKPLATDARTLLGVKELQTLVVKGKAQRDETGNLTVLASGIYVRPASAAKDPAEAGHDHDHDHSHEKPKSSVEKPTGPAQDK